jgi:uncharacterized protein (DUF697 family)
VTYEAFRCVCLKSHTASLNQKDNPVENVGSWGLVGRSIQKLSIRLIMMIGSQCGRIVPDTTDNGQTWSLKRLAISDDGYTGGNVAIDFVSALRGG